MSGGHGDGDWLRALERLPREVTPQRDPWPDIAARIEAGATPGGPGGHGRRWWPLAAAAALTAAIGLAVWMNAYLVPSASLPADPPANRVPGWAGSMQATEAEYLAALREIEALQWSRLRREEPLSGFANRGWATMIEAEQELVAALRRHPEDTYIKERLVQLRARQLGMLRLIASADMASRRQTI